MGLLDEKIAIVTGAASGIGRATARLLAREGAAVVVADVAQKGGHETVQHIEAAGGRATFVSVDVTDAGQVAAMVETAAETYGGLDILHANAGVPGPDKPLVDWSEEEWDQVVGVNLTGVFLTCRAAVPAMAERGGGAIVITASVAGIQAIPFTCAYNATKAGVISLTHTLALECAPLGIRVNAVAPGEVDTPMGLEALHGDRALLEACKRLIPLKRIAQPEEIASAVLYLASDAAAYVTGITLPVDGGIMLRNESMALVDDQ
jgi:NAD(P)-dependent dehydrogenase (short-subunit alcohol dehydrogenase family)